jgi:hypothetical protein
MKLKDGISLICVNAILKLKLGILIDVYAAGGSSDGRYRSCRLRCLLLHLTMGHALTTDEYRRPALTISIGNNSR